MAGARILIVEDSPTSLELMVYLLRAFGQAPLTATDGAAGVEMIRRERPDLVLMDIHMDGVDGYDALRQIRAEPGLAPLPVIAVTALAMVGDQESLLSAGFDGYISKPIAPEVFASQLDVFLPTELRSSRSRAVTPARAPSPSPPPARRGRVLVVDDTAANIVVVRAILRADGYEVEGVDTVGLARESLARELPLLILSDLYLAGESGYDLLRWVRSSPGLADVPFVFLSSCVPGQLDRSQALDEGADGFLTRPLDPGELLVQLDRLLQAKASGRPQT
jgi:two-component system cell cycle response regulator